MFCVCIFCLVQRARSLLPCCYMEYWVKEFGDMFLVAARDIFISCWVQCPDGSGDCDQMHLLYLSIFEIHFFSLCLGIRDYSFVPAELFFCRICLLRHLGKSQQGWCWMFYVCSSVYLRWKSFLMLPYVRELRALHSWVETGFALYVYHGGRIWHIWIKYGWGPCASRMYIFYWLTNWNRGFVWRLGLTSCDTTVSTG